VKRQRKRKRRRARPSSHPRNKLPLRQGSYRYVPARGASKVRGRPGYSDARANIWVWSPGIGAGMLCEHWDVEHPGGEHSNIDPSGEIHHGRVYREYF